MIDLSDFPYWDAMHLELKGKVSSKVRGWVKYIKNNQDGLTYQGDGQWVLNPLPGYNKTPYVIKNDKGNWYCNCQYFVKNAEQGNIVECSHIQIVKIVAGARRHNAKLKREGIIQ